MSDHFHDPADFRLLKEMKKLAPALDEAALKKVSAIGATSVLAALAKTYSAPTPFAGDTQPAGGSGILGTIFSAVVAGVVAGVVKQIAPKRRRRRSYTGYFGTRRRPVRRKRRARTPSLNDIFGQILGNRK